MPRKRKKRVVIIGNSAAALAGLDVFRARDQESKITMIDRETGPAYSRVITPYFIMGGMKKEENLYLRTEDYYKERNVVTRFGRGVESVDTRSREVVLDRGKREPFDLLLIASGGIPNRPRIEGVDPEEVLVLRNLSDARRLKELKPKVQKGVFIGAGLVSLQALQSLFKGKVQYTVVVKSNRILSQILDREASEIMERHLAGMGVRIVKGKDVVRLRKANGTKAAVLDDGEEIETDFIFAGKGVRPNTDFLEGSGIELKRGIMVNDHLETSIEGIYAAGDVAQAPDFFSREPVSYGLWPSAVEQGNIAGKNMAGLGEVYPGNLRMNVTRLFAMPMVSIGEHESERVAEVLTRKDEKKSVYRKISLDEKGRIIGAILINRMEDLGVLHGMIRSRKSGDLLKANSTWRSPVHYGWVHKEILKGRY